MYTILITCSLSIVNLTSYAWNSHDEKVLARAKHVCSTDYRYKHAPCLKVLTKVDERDYTALCGVRK
jgi:hypothetical protein